MRILAYDIGGTQGRCCLATVEANSAVKPVLGSISVLKRQTQEDGAAWLARLLACGRELTATAAPNIVSVSFGGPVAPNAPIVSVHVPGWETVDLRAELAAAFKVPVIVANDANAGAWGEFCFGAGRGCRTLVYFTVSTGIGGGVVLDGKLYTGAHGMAGEFGHMVLNTDRNAPKYAAGKPGVLEALSSGPAIARRATEILTERMSAVPASLTAQLVFDAARSGADWAIQVRDEAVAYLARGIAMSICAYDPERVVIGGGVSLAGDVLFVPLRAEVKRMLPYYLEGKAEVVPAELGDSAPLWGAVGLGRNELTATR